MIDDSPWETDGMRPLSGIRIIEMDAIGPVPFAAMLLAGMGADIVRIARPGGQATYEDLGEAIIHKDRSTLLLDLKTPRDRATVLELVADADALLEGYRPIPARFNSVWLQNACLMTLAAERAKKGPLGEGSRPPSAARVGSLNC